MEKSPGVQVEYSEFIKRYGVGLTGNIATGKTTVAKMIRDQGYTVIDADELSRRAVEPRTSGLAKIVEKFGAGILQADGSLDRRKLGEIIFSDEDKRKSLEQIIHPAIHDMLLQRLKDGGLLKQKNPWFYEASLLFETGSAKKFRAIWCTVCSEKEQLRRLLARDHITQDYASKVMKSQLSSKQKSQMSDLTFNTDIPLPELTLKVKAALADLNLDVKSQFHRL